MTTNLIATRDHDIVVIATWNDNGEGTNINRNYDYWYKGSFLPPDHFIETVRRDQCIES